MALSVLSALARLDIDPWHEAAELAQMPRLAAKQRLKSLIDELPEIRSILPDSEIASTRLIALLPSGSKSHGAAFSKVMPGTSKMMNPKSLIYVLVVNLLLVAGLTCVQLAESRSLSPGRGDDVESSVAVDPPKDLSYGNR